MDDYTGFSVIEKEDSTEPVVQLFLVAQHAFSVSPSGLSRELT